jgi:hypothetical protein
VSDDKGVLGNLPRSRPGRRSDKRAAGAGRPAEAAERAAERAEGRSARAARPPRSTAKRPAAGAPPKQRPAAAPRTGRRPAQPPPAGESGDPLGAAARTAAKAVGTGVRLGAGIAQEVLRRLPGR